MQLPRAAAIPQDERNVDCKPKPASTNEERALSGLGWFISSSVRDGHGVIIVSVSQGFDGMCRPEGYQDFVFVNGKFAGTLSPTLMVSRVDGASGRIRFIALNTIQVEFNRYSDQDPLCCPSRISEATYLLLNEGGQPLVVLKGVRTHPTR
jgi:hypothetical protein